MKLNYKNLGELIKRLDNRNTRNLDLELKGLSIDKKFISSVANTNGTDLKRYKVVSQNQFATNLMHVDRDKIVPIAIWPGDQDIIVSPAYEVFEVISKDDIIPEYLMMCLKMPIFDKNAWFLSGSSIRGNLTWDNFCKISIPVPSIKKQMSVIRIFSSIQDNISHSNHLIDKYRIFARAMYSMVFKTYVFNNSSNKIYHKSNYEFKEIRESEIAPEWEIVKLSDIAEQIKEPVKAGKQIYDKKYVPIDIIPKTRLILDNYISGKEAKSSLISFESNDILLGSMRVYFHRVSLASFSGITRSTVFVLRPYKNFDLSTILMSLDDDATILYATNNSRGTTMPYTVWEDGLANYKVIIPSIEIRKKFNSDLQKVLNYVVFQAKKIRKLKELEDELYNSLSSIY